MIAGSLAGLESSSTEGVLSAWVLQSLQARSLELWPRATRGMIKAPGAFFQADASVS